MIKLSLYSKVNSGSWHIKIVPGELRLRDGTSQLHPFLSYWGPTSSTFPVLLRHFLSFSLSHSLSFESSSSSSCSASFFPFCLLNISLLPVSPLFSLFSLFLTFSPSLSFSFISLLYIFLHTSLSFSPPLFLPSNYISFSIFFRPLPSFFSFVSFFFLYFFSVSFYLCIYPLSFYSLSYLTSRKPTKRRDPAAMPCRTVTTSVWVSSSDLTHW